MKFVFVVGPTASGKSGFAESLAENFQGSILNCDSIQCYQGLDIGSAKPSKEVQLKIPHFLFDMVQLGSTLTAGQYRRYFFESLPKIKTDWAAVVGGTGFYFQALEKGMLDIEASKPELIQSIEFELGQSGGAEKLWNELKAKDLESSKKISVNDHYRLVRAIEILRTYNKSLSDYKQELSEKQEKFPYPIMKIGFKIPVEELRTRIETRTQQMLDSGWVKETKSLLERVSPEWAPLNSVGYRQILDFLQGNLAERDLKNAIITSTMQLAKKQRTWFKRDPEIHWIEGGNENEILQKVLEFLRKH